jgi:hypothetical protein
MDNNQSDKEKEVVLVRKANVSVWGPIYITLNLERTSSTSQSQSTQQSTQPDANIEETKSEAKIVKNPKAKETPKEDEDESAAKKSVNILSKKDEKTEIEPDEKPQSAEALINQPKDPNQNKKITYIYNLIDHGLDCECIDVKGELLIRSALPSYRKISQGIEFEQITTNQIKLIITSRVIDNYQEVFQGFSLPKATFRIWVLGYKFH